MYIYTSMMSEVSNSLFVAGHFELRLRSEGRYDSEPEKNVESSNHFIICTKQIDGLLSFEIRSVNYVCGVC